MGKSLHCVHDLQRTNPTLNPRDAQTKAHGRALTANPYQANSKDVTEEQRINLDNLYDTLKKANYKEEEIEIIISTLQITEIGQ